MFTELLESRRMMTVAASAALGTLYVYGDDYANGIRVLRSGTDIVVQNRTSGGTYAEIYRVADSGINSAKISARAGADKIEVDFDVQANVTIYGGHGADWIKTGGDDCVAYGDYPIATASEPDDNAADTLINGASGQCTLQGQGGDDKLYTGLPNIDLPVWGKDYLYGGDGNDKFYTAYGNPSRLCEAWGSVGDDTLYAGPNRAVDFYGGYGRDTADFSGSLYEGVYIRLDGIQLSGSLAHPGDRRIMINHDVENATGSPRGDDIAGNELNNILSGGDGWDDIFGGKGNDFIFGGNGNDSIEGGHGNDYCYGEAGNDTLWGDHGNDSLFGGSGADYFYAQDNMRDSIYGGTSIDEVLSKDGVDYVTEVP